MEKRLFCVVFTKYFAEQNFEKKILGKMCFAMDIEHYGPIPELSRQILDGCYAS